MLEPVDERGGELVDLAELAVDGVPFEDGDDLVVGLHVVDHPEAPDRDHVHQDVAVGDGLLGEDADVERVAVSHDPFALRLLAQKAAFSSPQ